VVIYLFSTWWLSKKGEQEVPGLTDVTKPRRLGPKRASKIRKLFNLGKEDDVRKFVIRRQVVKGDKKPKFKAPRIQRLITPQRLQRKRAERSEHKRRQIKAKQDATDFNALVIKRIKEAKDKDKRSKAIAAKRSQSARPSQGAVEATKPASTAPATKSASKKTDKKTDVPAAKGAPASAKVVPVKAAPAATAKPAGKKN